jgi:hypothetical protein
MHDDVNRKLGFTAAPTHAPRQCRHDAPMSCRYPIHGDQHDPGSTAICINARVYARSLSAAATPRGFLFRRFPLRTNIAFFRLIIRSYINVQDEPRPWLARLVLLGARDVTAMVVGSGALLARFSERFINLSVDFLGIICGLRNDVKNRETRRCENRINERVTRHSLFFLVRTIVQLDPQ